MDYASGDSVNLTARLQVPTDILKQPFSRQSDGLTPEDRAIREVYVLSLSYKTEFRGLQLGRIVQPVSSTEQTQARHDRHSDDRGQPL